MKKRLQISALARSLALAAATAMMLLALAGLAANRVHAGAASAPALATQPIVVDGDITADTIWRAADAPYFLVVKPIRILSTATLTIEAGVEVRFQTASSLTVEGGLAAQGTQEHQVFLIGSDGAAWQGLIAGPAARGVTLQSATIKNASVGLAIPPLAGGRAPRVDVVDSLLTLNGTAVGVDFTGAGGARVTMRNNLLLKNGVGLLASGDPKGAARVKLNHNSFRQNGIALQAIGVTGNGLKAQQQWWGSSTGPLANTSACASPPLPGGSAPDLVCGNVDYQPWSKVPTGRAIVEPGQQVQIESEVGPDALSSDAVSSTSMVTLTVPAGAFGNRTVDLLVAPREPLPTLPPGQPTLISLEITAAAGGQAIHQFAPGKQLRLEITYTDKDLNGADPRKLLLYFFDEATGTWRFGGFASVPDPANRRLVVTMSHLTRMRVMSTDLPTVYLPVLVR